MFQLKSFPLNSIGKNLEIGSENIRLDKWEIVGLIIPLIILKACAKEKAFRVNAAGDCMTLRQMNNVIPFRKQNSQPLAWNTSFSSKWKDCRTTIYHVQCDLHVQIASTKFETVQPISNDHSRTVKNWYRIHWRHHMARFCSHPNTVLFHPEGKRTQGTARYMTLLVRLSEAAQFLFVLEELSGPYKPHSDTMHTDAYGCIRIKSDFSSSNPKNTSRASLVTLYHLVRADKNAA